MLSKLSTTQQILILIGILLAGLILGNILPPVSTWFASSVPKAGDKCKTKDTPPKDGTLQPDADGKLSCKSTGRIIYDTARCCQAGNPCGWSKATHDAQCGA